MTNAEYYKALFDATFLYKTFDYKTGEEIEKECRVTGVCDGPGADRRDYCFVEGIEDYEVDMPLENFLNNSRVKINQIEDYTKEDA